MVLFWCHFQVYRNICLWSYIAVLLHDCIPGDSIFRQHLPTMSVLNILSRILLLLLYTWWTWHWTEHSPYLLMRRSQLITIQSHTLLHTLWVTQSVVSADNVPSTEHIIIIILKWSQQSTEYAFVNWWFYYYGNHIKTKLYEQSRRLFHTRSNECELLAAVSLSVHRGTCYITPLASRVSGSSLIRQSAKATD